jgi:hypothetical protein
LTTVCARANSGCASNTRTRSFSRLNLPNSLPDSGSVTTGPVLEFTAKTMPAVTPASVPRLMTSV